MSDKGVIDIKKAVSNAFNWFYNCFEKQRVCRKALHTRCPNRWFFPSIPYPILVPGIIRVFRKPATKPSHCLPSAGHGLSPALFVFTPHFPHTTNFRFNLTISTLPHGNEYVITNYVKSQGTAEHYKQPHKIKDESQPSLFD
jgi:hypothetical protein